MIVCLFEFIPDKVQLVQLDFSLVVFLIRIDPYQFVVFITDSGFINLMRLFFG